jgi:hypothetical protein
VKQISKPYFKSKIDFIVREAEHIIDRYDVSNGKAKHVMGLNFFIR